MVRSLSDVIDGIYAAGVDQHGWSDALAAIAARLGATNGHLLIETGAGGLHARAGQGPWSAEAFDACRGDYFALNARFAAGRAMLLDEAVPRPAWLRSRLFNEVVRPVGGGEGVGVQLWRTTDRHVFLMLGREFGHAFDARARSRLAPLVGHLQRATATTIAAMAQSLALEAAILAADSEGAAVAVVDAQLRPHYLSPAAAALLRRGGPWQVSAAGAIGDRTGRLAAAALALSAGDGRDLAPRRLEWSAGRRTWHVRLHRAAMSRLLVLRFDVVARTPPPAERFGLTPAEARIADIVAREAPTLAEMADRLGVSVNTIRTHLAHIFAKTGVNRQAELVKRLHECASVRPVMQKDDD